MNYERYYTGLSDKLKDLYDTQKITDAIKEYTKNFFKADNNKIVRYSDNGGEFLYDVSVLSFNPNNIVNSKNRKININNITTYKAYLLLESELGGNSASSAYGVFKNVVEDFSKLLIGNSKYKVMIMAVSPYKGESNYIENRLEILQNIYDNSDCNSDISIIVIEGKHDGGKSNQIKLDTKKMHLKKLERQINNC